VLPSCGTSLPDGSKVPSHSPKTSKESRVSSAWLMHPRWMPEKAGLGRAEQESLPDGTKFSIFHGLRIAEHPEGEIEVSDDLLPGRATYHSLKIPERMGGGYLFYASYGTRILYRSESFLGKLIPLIELAYPPAHISIGPDRLLVSLNQGSNHRTIGLDLKTAEIGPPSPLPPAINYGNFSFIDVWRGVVIVDLVGVMMTLDAGASWRKVAIDDSIHSISHRGNDFDLAGYRGHYLLDEHGNLQQDVGQNSAQITVHVSKKKKPPPKPFGKHPLRTAIELGYPLTNQTAVVARKGHIAKIRLSDGKIVEIAKKVMPAEEDSECRAIRFGKDVGFVCGSVGKGTTLYQLGDGLSVIPIANFAHPRAVLPSGQGALTVRGSCKEDEKPNVRSRKEAAYCVFLPSGKRKEIHTKGDVGEERLVALSDGRVLVIVPPRKNGTGTITILPKSGKQAKLLKIASKDESTETSFTLQNSLWMDGIQEVDKDTIAIWLEGGDLLQGMHVSLVDGTAELGKPQEAGDYLVSGLFASSAIEDHKITESNDGGKTWIAHTIPEFYQQPGVVAGRFCSAVGCVVPTKGLNWLKIGWGEPDEKRFTVPKNQRPYHQTITSKPYSRNYYRLSCQLTKDQRPKVKNPIGHSYNRYGRYPSRYGHNYYPPSYSETNVSSWESFWGTSAPTIPKGFATFQTDTYGGNDGVSARMYVWAPKGFTGGKAGRWQARYLDLYDPQLRVHSSSTTIGNWADEDAISFAMGRNTSVAFHSLVDSGGKAGMIASCDSSSLCTLFGIVDGQPIVQLSLPSGHSLASHIFNSSSMIWMNNAFYLLVNQNHNATLYKLTANNSTVLKSFPRSTNSPPHVTLIRRNLSNSMGIFQTSSSGSYSDSPFGYVIPIDPETGETGEASQIGISDYGKTIPKPCTKTDDGWLYIEYSSPSFVISLPEGHYVNNQSMRMRIDDHQSCLDGIFGSLGGSGQTSKKAPVVKTTGPQYSYNASFYEGGYGHFECAELSPTTTPARAKVRMRSPVTPRLGHLAYQGLGITHSSPWGQEASLSA
jgi:hypothetical protein